jgi:hypothetical protein
MMALPVLLAALLTADSSALLTPAESAQTVLEAAERLGAPFEESLIEKVATAERTKDLWDTLKPHTLLEVELNPEMRVKVAAGPAKTDLVAGKPRAFFVRVDNACGATARLALTATDLAAANASEPDWLDIEIVNDAGCSDRLSGAPVEYKLLICRVREPGRRESRLGLDAGQGTQDLGFRGVTDILFHVRPDEPH